MVPYMVFSSSIFFCMHGNSSFYEAGCLKVIWYGCLSEDLVSRNFYAHCRHVPNDSLPLPSPFPFLYLLFFRPEVNGVADSYIGMDEKYVIKVNGMDGMDGELG